MENLVDAKSPRKKTGSEVGDDTKRLGLKEQQSSAIRKGSIKSSENSSDEYVAYSKTPAISIIQPAISSSSPL